MKESVGYTVTLNIAITFIIIVFAFLSAVLMYYKSYKVSNIVTNSIEKYEGFNNFSNAEINTKLGSIGYTALNATCPETKDDRAALGGECSFVAPIEGVEYPRGTCIYLCTDKDDDSYYYYKIRTNMTINVPIINNILNIPVYSNTNKMYDYRLNLGQ